MQKITPCLWFDGQAEEAMNFYISIFKNSKVLQTSYYGEGAPKPKGTVLTVVFQIDGQEFMGLNGGPEFKFNEAISLSVACKTQEEIDNYWEKLSAGGEKSQCGWLKDKYGVSWQIVPEDLSNMISDKDPKKSQKVLDAVMKMNKLDIKTLKQAYEQ